MSSPSSPGASSSLSSPGALTSQRMSKSESGKIGGQRGRDEAFLVRGMA